jgi:hypothetical protein
MSSKTRFYLLTEQIANHLVGIRDFGLELWHQKTSENSPNPCQETENKKLRQIEIYL